MGRCFATVPQLEPVKPSNPTSTKITAARKGDTLKKARNHRSPSVNGAPPLLDLQVMSTAPVTKALCALVMPVCARRGVEAFQGAPRGRGRNGRIVEYNLALRAGGEGREMWYILAPAKKTHGPSTSAGNIEKSLYDWFFRRRAQGLALALNVIS
jgi:hypothetical protein